MLTDRGRSLLLLGGVVYLVAWAFGARALYPLAVGLVLAVVAAALWVRMLRRPMRLRRSLWRGEHLAGDDVHVGLELDVEGWMPPVPLVARERIARLGEQEAVLRRAPGGLAGGYTSRPCRAAATRSSRRGRDRGSVRARARSRFRSRGPAALLVYPRLVELETTLLGRRAAGRPAGGS